MPPIFRLKTEVTAVTVVQGRVFSWLAQAATAVQPQWDGTRAAVEVHTKLDVALLMNAHFDHLPEPLAVDHRAVSPICSNVQHLQRAFPATILIYGLTLMNWATRSFPVSKHRLLRLH